MRLNFGRRLVLFINWLLSLAGCALAVTMVVWPECRETALALLEREGLTLKIYAIAVLAVYLIFAVGAICIIFGGKKKREKNAFISVASSDSGRTRIAVGAVDQMIRQAVRGVDGIADMKATIINNEDSIAIAADVAIRSGAHVPTVTSNIQRSIRGYIEQNCGVAVRGVSVSVHSLADPEETGRRGRRRKQEAAYVKPAVTPVTPADPGRYDYGKLDSDAPTQPLPKIEPEEEPAWSFSASPAPEPEAPVDLPEDDEPISLTLDSEPEAVVSADGDFVDESAPAAEEAPATEEAPAAAEEAPAAESAPAQKKGLFGRLFGKRNSSAEVAPAEAPSEERDGQE